MNPETLLQNKIMCHISSLGHYVERSNHGVYYTKDGRTVTIGNVGQSDLRGHRKDGRAFYFEVKTKTGRPTKEQLNFLEQMRKTGAISGIVHSEKEAEDLLNEI